MSKIKQAEFINYEIWILTFGGGFQRVAIYANNVSDKTKAEFRAAIRNKINKIVREEYKNTNVSSEDHVKTIIDIKKWIDKNHSNILKNGEVMLGVVQKLLNLYLKYQWCLGLVHTPPHCPFDRIIISQMKLPNPPAWTKLNSVKTYKMLVKKAKELADNKTIAEWELDVFARR